MYAIAVCPIPKGALLDTYKDEKGGYTDCYSIEVTGLLTLADFVFAFYTTPLFKLERAILRFLASKPSTDHHAKQLANGVLNSFAAWHVEQRTEDQLLMCDYRGRTRSWFMVTPNAQHSNTLLQFGSAVVPRASQKTGEQELSRGFNVLLGFHKLYSKALLHAAKLRLEKLLH